MNFYDFIRNIYFNTQAHRNYIALCINLKKNGDSYRIHKCLRYLLFSLKYNKMIIIVLCHKKET